MDQLHMHFASAIHNTAFTMVLGYVELGSGSGGTSNFQKRQYADLCQVSWLDIIQMTHYLKGQNLKLKFKKNVWFAQSTTEYFKTGT